MSDAVMLVGNEMIYFPELETSYDEIMMPWETLRGLE